jgi:quercetin dioxygenase-like cupin family protein
MPMQTWNLEDRSDTGRSGPLVLFSTPEARLVVLDLDAGEEVGEHRVRERLTVLVVDGCVQLSAADGAQTLRRGGLALFEPSEGHAVRALEASRLVLTLAPWPAPDHYGDGAQGDPHALPVNATLPPAR